MFNFGLNRRRNNASKHYIIKNILATIYILHPSALSIKLYQSQPTTKYHLNKDISATTSDQVLFK